MKCPRCGERGLKSLDANEFFCLAHGTYEFLPATYPDPALDDPPRGGRRASTPEYVWTDTDEATWKEALEQAPGNA
jgi:hypothetical protein